MTCHKCKWLSTHSSSGEGCGNGRLGVQLSVLVRHVAQTIFYGIKCISATRLLVAAKYSIACSYYPFT